MADLFNYLLSGQRASELSAANTTLMLGADCRWALEIPAALGLPDRLLGRLIEPGTPLGPLADGVRDDTGLDAPLVATCGHDTSAAVAAVPAEGDDWAFLSCGTWGILGGLIDRPITTEHCRLAGFTNEYTVGGWYLARNTLGLWLLQQLRRKWDTPDDHWTYDRLAAEAAAAVPCGVFVVSSYPDLLAPSDMEKAMLAQLDRSGQAPPTGRGALARAVIEGLALEYAVQMDCLAQITGRSFDRL